MSPRPRPRIGARSGPAPQLCDPARPERPAHRDRPGREGTANHDEDEDPRPGRLPCVGAQRGQPEDRDAGVGDDRVADDVLEVVLDERRERPEEHARGPDRHDHGSLDRQRQQESRTGLAGVDGDTD